MAAVVDIQGFAFSGEFYVKELCIVPVEDRKPYIAFLFHSPRIMKSLTREEWRTMEYQERLHGFRWKQGRAPADSVQKIIKYFCGDYKVIFVKGSEKKNIIASLLKETVVVEEIFDDSLDESVKRRFDRCPFPHTTLNPKYCAVIKAQRFAATLQRRGRVFGRLSEAKHHESSTARDRNSIRAGAIRAALEENPKAVTPQNLDTLRAALEEGFRNLQQFDPLGASSSDVFIEAPKPPIKLPCRLPTPLWREDSGTSRCSTSKLPPLARSQSRRVTTDLHERITALEEKFKNLRDTTFSSRCESRRVKPRLARVNHRSGRIREYPYCST